MNKKIVSYLMTFSIFVAVSSNDIYVPSMPEMVKYFNTTGSLIGLTITTFLVGMAVGTLMWGTISDKYGRKTILCIAAFVYGVICLCIAISPDIYTVLILRLFQGIATSAFAIVGRLLLNDFLKGTDLFRSLNLMNIGTVISPAIAPILGAQLMRLFDWRADFIFSSIMGFLILILCLKYVKETKQDKLQKLPSIRSWIMDYVNVGLNWHSFINNLFIMANFGIYFSFITISSFIYINDFGLSPTAYSLFFFLASIAFFVGSYFAKYFKEKHRYKTNLLKMMLFGDIVNVIAVIFIIANLFDVPLTLHIIFITFGFCLSRFAFAFMFTPAQIRTLEFFPEKKGHSLGACFFLMFISGASSAAWVSSFDKTPLVGIAVVVTSLVVILIIFQVFYRKVMLKNNSMQD